MHSEIEDGCKADHASGDVTAAKPFTHTYDKIKNTYRWRKQAKRVRVSEFRMVKIDYSLC